MLPSTTGPAERFQILSIPSLSYAQIEYLAAYLHSHHWPPLIAIIEDDNYISAEAIADAIIAWLTTSLCALPTTQAYFRSIVQRS